VYTFFTYSYTSGILKFQILINNENILWMSKILAHKNSLMILQKYTRYIPSNDVNRATQLVFKGVKKNVLGDYSSSAGEGGIEESSYLIINNTKNTDFKKIKYTHL